MPVTLPFERPDGKPETRRLLVSWIHDGGHVKARNYSEGIWKPALVKAKVIPPPTKVKRGHLRYATTRHEGFHQLRHHYASTMLANNVSIPELAAILGHADPGFTLRVYGHLLPNSFDRVRNAVDGRMFRPRAVAGGT